MSLGLGASCLKEPHFPVLNSYTLHRHRLINKQTDFLSFQ